MAYTAKLKKLLFNVKVLAWSMSLEKRDKPKNADTIHVWWELNGSSIGTYDIFWYVGKTDHTGKCLSWLDRVDGGYITIPKTNTYALYKRARKLEYQLKRKYPTYQTI